MALFRQFFFIFCCCCSFLVSLSLFRVQVVSIELLPSFFLPSLNVRNTPSAPFVSHCRMEMNSRINFFKKRNDAKRSEGTHFFYLFFIFFRCCRPNATHVNDPDRTASAECPFLSGITGFWYRVFFLLSLVFPRLTIVADSRRADSALLGFDFLLFSIKTQ